MLAHGAQVVGVAARVVLGDADDGPVVGDLVRALGVQPQRAPADLRDGRRGGRAAEVDDDVERRAVPALAEQPAGADEDLRAPRLQPAGEQRHPDARRPPDPGGEGDQGAVAVERVVEQPVGQHVRDERPEGEEVLAAHRDGAPGDQDRAQPRPEVAACEREERQPGRAGGLLLGRLGQRRGRLRGPLLEVAQHGGPQLVAERVRLGLQHVHRRAGLGRRQRADPVDRGGRRAQAPHGQQVAQARQHRADRLEQPGVLEGARGRQVLAGVGLQQHPPVLRVGGDPVLLAQPRPAGQLHDAAVREPEPGPRQVRLGLLEVLPGQLRPAALEPTVVQPSPQPVRERQRAGAQRQQLELEVGEALPLGDHPGVLLGRRRRQVDQLLVGRELALLDDRGRRHREVAVAEELVVQLGLPRGHRGARGGGQPDHPGVVAERADQSAAQRAPGLEQVVALVEHQRPRSGRGGAPHQLPPARVQQREQVRPRLTAQRRPTGLGQRRGGVVLLVLVVGGAVPHRQRLVGQHRDRGHQRALGAGRPRVRPVAAELLPLRQPLRLHGGVRREHHRAAAEPAGDLEAHHRLARTRRHDDVRPRLAVGAQRLEGVERLALVAAEGAGEGAAVPGVSYHRGILPGSARAGVRARRGQSAPGSAPGSGPPGRAATSSLTRAQASAPPSTSSPAMSSIAVP